MGDVEPNIASDIANPVTAGNEAMAAIGVGEHHPSSDSANIHGPPVSTDKSPASGYASRNQVMQVARTSADYLDVDHLQLIGLWPKYCGRKPAYLLYSKAMAHQ